MSVLTFTNENFQQEVLNSSEKVLVDFFCHMVRALQNSCRGGGKSGRGAS